MMAVICLSMQRLGGSQTRNIKPHLESRADLKREMKTVQLLLGGAVEEYTLQMVPILLDQGDDLEIEAEQ